MGVRLDAESTAGRPHAGGDGSEPESAAVALGRDEGVPDPVPDPARDAGAVVPDPEDDRLLGPGDTGQGDLRRGGRCGVDRVVHELVDHELGERLRQVDDGARIAFHRRDDDLALHLESAESLAHDLAQIDESSRGPGWNDVPDPACSLGGLETRVLDAVEEAAELLGVLDRSHRRGAADRHREVVDVVDERRRE